MNKNTTFILRSLWRQKEFSLLNVLGLGVGIGSALVLFMLIRYERSFDTFHTKLDRIYRVVSSETYRSGITEFDGDAPVPLVDALRREFPQVEAAADVYRSWQQIDIPGKGGAEKKFVSESYFVEPSLFSILDFPWLQGNPQADLSEPYTMAIAQSVAETWFGHWQDVVGKTVLVGDERRPYQITGIMKDPPPNTDVSIKIAFSFATFRTISPGWFTDPVNWDSFSSGSQCYFLLKRGATIAAMNRLLPGFVATHYTPLFEHSDSRDSSFFQPLKEMHFDATLDHPGKPSLSSNELWALGLIGCFLLLVACINFINLATALSINRAKEVGVRKVLGSNRNQLLLRFLGETAFLVGLSLLLGCILAELAIGPIARLLDKDISPTALFSPGTLLFLLAMGIAVTVLAGVYPGMVLSGFNPTHALKSKVSTRTIGGVSLRRGLVVFQFVIAQLLIVGTFVVLRQMHYFRTKPLGYDDKAIALVDIPSSNPRNAYFKNKVLQIPGVRAASLCNSAPSNDGVWTSGFTLEHHTHQEGFEVVYKMADADFLSTFHIGLAAGRAPYPSDTIREVMVNETTARDLGYRNPADIVGKTISITYRDKRDIPIVGVVRDFVSTTLRVKIKPLILLTDTAQYSTLAVALDPEKIGEAMPRIETLFGDLYPERIYNASFVDERVASLYKTEVMVVTLFKLFAGLAIFISCLGLYGLVSFMAAQKTKEVGIRKTLGASVQSIVLLFSKEFTLLTIGAFVIAGPLGYYLMSKWLQQYYYQTTIGWDIFAAAIGLSIAIAWATVGYRAVRAALADPVKALKHE